MPAPRATKPCVKCDLCEREFYSLAGYRSHRCEKGVNFARRGAGNVFFVFRCSSDAKWTKNITWYSKKRWPERSFRKRRSWNIVKRVSSMEHRWHCGGAVDDKNKCEHGHPNPREHSEICSIPKRSIFIQKGEHCGILQGAAFKRQKEKVRRGPGCFTSLHAHIFQKCSQVHNFITFSRYLAIKHKWLASDLSSFCASLKSLTKSLLHCKEERSSAKYERAESRLVPDKPPLFLALLMCSTFLDSCFQWSARPFLFFLMH